LKSVTLPESLAVPAEYVVLEVGLSNCNWHQDGDAKEYSQCELEK
jgi:hypothetical protein